MEELSELTADDIAEMLAMEFEGSTITMHDDSDFECDSALLGNHVIVTMERAGVRRPFHIFVEEMYGVEHG